MLDCSAPTYPPKNRPYTIQIIANLRFFYFQFFSNSVNKHFFKIIKRCILIEERLQRLLWYAFLPYIQHL